jgi:membrane protease YdiL (CAAX protease family)
MNNVAIINFLNKKDLVGLETIITAVVILICILLYAFFPIKNEDSFQQIVLNIVFLFFVPFLYIKIVFKDKMKNFGFQIIPWKGGFWIMPACFLIAGLFAYLIFEYTDFQKSYFLGRFEFVNDFWYLFFYEFVVVNLFVLLSELFFRGFVMFYFEKKIGLYSIFIQFLFFVLFLGILERLNLDNIFYLPVALLAGLIAYKSKSLIYSYFFSIIILVIVDIIYLKFIK